MQEISEQHLRKLKSSITIDKSLGDLIQDSLEVGVKPTDNLLKAKAAREDCQTFRFDIKLFKVSGSICKNGDLDFKGSVFGVEIAHTTADLSEGQFCQNPKVGKLVGIKYCFSFKNNCLYTSGQIDGWFEKRTSWNEKILCF